ncbi:hypothetical protein ACFIQF_11580 [Comamonas sp. J-3]|uniref:hypothetical protein n=1 Tax=Comamonas trifloxystrobinivorans TaxID=3350256 RepID=UPI00372A2D8C
MKRIFATARMTACALAASTLWLLAGCSGEQSKPSSFALTEEGIKTLSPKIAKVVVTPQVDGPESRVEIELNSDPNLGGKGEWNSLAQDSHSMFTRLLAKPEVSRVFIKVVSPANKNLHWARVSVDRSKLPSDWQNLTYLQFFAHTNPMAGTLQTGQWLCEFYAAYQSAQPPGGLPRNCKG